MKKIFVDKNEGVAEVVEKIIGEEETDLVLVIPKGSQLRESVSNFHLIRREAASSGKKVFIESVDEEVLVLAKTSDLEATHPLFEGERKGSSFSDIVPRGSGKEVADLSSDLVGKAKGEQSPAILPPKMKSSAAAPVIQKTEAPKVAEIAKTKEIPPYYIVTKRRYITPKSALFIAVPVIIITLAFLMVSIFFNKASITLSFIKTPWNYEHAFSVDKSVSEIDFNNNVLPGGIFSDSKTWVQSYLASSKKTVSEKASGTITIYNAYSSERQTLVATTRFVTSDGKIFRIPNQVIVPGAKITNGKIIPSSIDAKVVADETGEKYNTGPIQRLTIPGFKGTPRYDGFYGELKQGTSGGFVGEKAVPTADDIAKAKDKTTEVLRANLDNSFTAAYPADCKILEGAKQFNVTRLKVDENTNASGTFNVFGEANVVALCFRESGEKSLKSFLTTAAAKGNPNMVFDELQINYSQIKTDLKGGKETFYVTAAGMLKPDFSAEDLKSKVLGKKVDDARSVIALLPKLASAKISLWPIWLWNVPSNPDRVKITVN